MTRSGVRSPSAPPVHQKSADFLCAAETRGFSSALATQRCYTRGMEDVAKQTWLVRRKDSSSWQFRQRWPKHLRRPGDPEDIWISLETSSYQDALRKLPEVRAEAQRRFTHADDVDQRDGIYSRTSCP